MEIEQGKCEEDEQDEKVCYVCMDYCETLSRCACKHRYIHTSCLIKLVETNDFCRDCSVCKHPLTNVRVANMRQDWRPTWLLVMTMLFICLVVTEVFLSVLISVAVLRMPYSAISLASGSVFSAFSVIVGLLYIRRLARLRHVAGSPVWAYKKVTRARVHVRNVAVH